MPRAKNERRSIKDSGSKPVRLRIRSDSEINRLSGAALDKENENAAKPNKTEVTKKMKDDLVEKEVELSTVKESTSIEADIGLSKDEVVNDSDYYKKLYQECRDALSIALEENERLYNEMDLLKAENEQLRQIIEQVVAEEAIIP